ncbi:MAG TPA: response regulator [Blastocatellia bacterium]|nr:response regulator [Blastocatellia bacterium]
MAKILVVDDRAINREFLTTLLGYKGHQLFEAQNGAEALEIVRAERPDLVITDILMPVMDGYEFVRQLHSDASIAQPRIIFYTAHYLEREARSLAEACGVSHLLFKPSEPEDVIRTVEAALEIAATHAQPIRDEEFDRQHLRLVTDKLSQKADELRRVNIRLNALVELSLQLSSEGDVQRLLENFCRSARDIIGARYSAVGVADRDGRSLHQFFIYGAEASALGEYAPPSPWHGELERLRSDRRPFRLSGLQDDPRSLDLPPCGIKKNSALLAPIVSLTHLYGWICLVDKIAASAFTDEDERLAGILAAQVGRIYENGSLYAELKSRTLDLEREVISRRRTEEALRESEARMRRMAESNMIGISFWDVNGNITDANDEFLRIVGRTREDLTAGRVKWSEMTPPEYSEADARAIEEMRRTGTFAPYEKEYIRDDGARVPVLIGGAFFEGSQTQGVAFILDITNRKNLEEQLVQAQKMEAVGRLAGGIAHDFNNLLTAIIGYSQLVLSRLGESDPARKEVEQIQRAGERAAALTGQLLAFSRKQVMQPKVLDLNREITEMNRMVRRMIGEDIDLVLDLEPALGQVKADPGQIAQVIMNLAVNSRDAMPGGGKLIIETRNVRLEEEYVSRHLDVAPGDYVMLALSDSGVGMDEETLSHIFEPFFTTKEAGKGTGLGLSTVYGIVKQTGGHIWIYSEPGRGTTVKVYLPRVDEMAEVSSARAPFSAMPRGTETVLLVEDDRTLLTLACQVLEMSGYTVLNAASGEEAIELSKQHKGPIHLLLTDVVMPRMSGRELVEKLTSARPHTKVLYMSGYTDDSIVHHGVLEADMAYLQKPFTPDSLARKVREVLDAP